MNALDLLPGHFGRSGDADDRRWIFLCRDARTTRPRDRGIAAPAERQGDQSKAQTIEAAGEPTYFRSISAISPGSLAGVYQSMRAQEASSGFDAGGIEPVRAEAAAAILSGAGIPAAMTAYGEVMEAEGE
ncbi:hypothetical protein [Neoaquamicrobium sediminum]|uniref:hypothetical protein n=1 Tax=Neoaquamicrobium sediminum TaxID=1849104 RepID=UPI001563FFF8|nr:hypothetical protein [Mesorhizobium sediminum]NRC55046.1 hypothetical protein [Mesorhizobium sediminum]